MKMRQIPNYSILVGIQHFQYQNQTIDIKEVHKKCVNESYFDSHQCKSYYQSSLQNIKLIPVARRSVSNHICQMILKKVLMLCNSRQLVNVCVCVFLNIWCHLTCTKIDRIYEKKKKDEFSVHIFDDDPVLFLLNKRIFVVARSYMLINLQIETINTEIWNESYCIQIEGLIPYWITIIR